jgi:alkylation response protein AidB-like acyl-CoA dehydrogenase
MSNTEHFGEIFFDDVRVEEDRLVGMPGEGWKISMHLFQWERGMYAWLRQASLTNTVRRLAPSASGNVANERQLGSVIQDVVALRARSRKTIGALARGVECGPRVSIDKLLLARAEKSVQDLASVLESVAIDTSLEADWTLRTYEYLHSRVASIYGGSSEIQKTIVATQLLGLPR